MKKFLFIFLNIAITSSCFSQEPMQLAKLIFAQDSFALMQNHITGEYDGKPNGKDIDNKVQIHFRILEQTDSSAVINMTVIDSIKHGIDTYLFFEKDSVWKMSAFRALAQTGILENIKYELENMTPEKIEETIQLSKKNKQKETFSSIEEYNMLLGELRLTLDLDDTIIKHFNDNRVEFERIKEIVLKELETIKINEEQEINIGKNIEIEYKRLYVSSISIGGYEFGNCLNFTIGGMLDNTVGYMYVRDKKDLPHMSSHGFIMIREIGNGWYIYKTT